MPQDFSADGGGVDAQHVLVIDLLRIKGDLQVFLHGGLEPLRGRVGWLGLRGLGYSSLQGRERIELKLGTKGWLVEADGVWLRGKEEMDLTRAEIHEQW